MRTHAPSPARTWCPALLTGLIGLAACNLDVAAPSAPILVDALDELATDALHEVLPIVGAGVGEACAAPGDCRTGLACEGGSCTPSGALPAGTPCLLSAECAAGHYCSMLGVCAPAGSGDTDAPCATAADCLPSHTCLVVGLSGACAPGGDRDLGQACQQVTDCFAGLRCADDGTCQAGSALFGAPFFAGVACAPDDQIEGPPRIFFEVPRAGTPVTEFYRLPFPSDVRLRNGRVDLSGHPVPGKGLIGVDLVQRLIDAIEADADGFATNPTIFFRSSVGLDYGTVSGSGDARTVRMVDVTKGSPDYGKSFDLGWFATTDRDKYICRNSLRLHRPWSRPLRPGTTYAVLLTDGLRTAKGTDEAGNETPGQALTPDADFTAMLSDSRPGDADLAHAWDAFAPVRAWLADVGGSPADWVGGTVFTTARVRDVLPPLRAAVDARPAPIFTEWTVCDAGVTSPCQADDEARACTAASTDLWELHARVTLPRMQSGTRPYLSPSDGGSVDLGSAGGAAKVQGDESVCVALSVPKGVAMPDAGWPVLLYAHGTGGDFRNAIRNGTAGRLAQLDAGGEALGVATLGWDQVMHGPRRGSTLSPDVLVYNFLNPRAARGNFLQAATDTLALVKALGGLEVPAEASPTGQAIRVDANRLLFMGHSQGGTSGPLAIPWAPEVRAVVYSGAGGGLALSLMAKTQPVPILEGVKFALQDPAVRGDHPVLGLIQMYFDPVDPLNYAGVQFAFPDEGTARHHVLHGYGLDDHYTPPDCIRSFAGAMYTTLAEPVRDPIGGLASAPLPLTGNWAGTTGVTVEYEPGDYDGHFVFFRHPDGIRHLEGFVESALRDPAPTVGP